VIEDFITPLQEYAGGKEDFSGKEDFGKRNVRRY